MGKSGGKTALGSGSRADNWGRFEKENVLKKLEAEDTTGGELMSKLPQFEGFATDVVLTVVLSESPGGVLGPATVEDDLR